MFLDIIVRHNLCIFVCHRALDPHIKVEGLPESVRLAKEKVMAVLDTKVRCQVQFTDVGSLLYAGGQCYDYLNTLIIIIIIIIIKV